MSTCLIKKYHASMSTVDKMKRIASAVVPYFFARRVKFEEENLDKNEAFGCVFSLFSKFCGLFSTGVLFLFWEFVSLDEGSVE